MGVMHHQPLADSKGMHREVESEGSWWQNSGSGKTNIIRQGGKENGGAGLVSCTYSVALKNGFKAFQDDVATTYQNVVLNTIGGTIGIATGNAYNVISNL